MAIDRLDSETLIRAYAAGYFPMGEPKTGEIFWYLPKTRAIIPLDKFHVSHSLRKKLRQETFRVTFDQAFASIMQGCANRTETWITAEFIRAYTELHYLGLAHSVEVWQGENLVGGVYGVSLGGAFFAESMFHKARDASKVALYYLVERLNQRGFQLLETQFLTPHLASLGAVEIPGDQYQQRLHSALQRATQW